MLDLLGSNQRFCDRLSRRAMLRIGALAPLGLSLPMLLGAKAAQANNTKSTKKENSSNSNPFGKAKRCLMIYMWGGPAHQDLYDMKPDAPAEYRGEFSPVRTNVPGIQITELMPHMARQMDKIGLIRSVTHTDNNHSTAAHWMLTGRRHQRSAENFGARQSDFPHIGSVISKLMPGKNSLPTFVALPEVIATTAGAVTPGQGGGILGRHYDPFRISDHPDKADFKVANLTLPKGVSQGRLGSRINLLHEFDSARRGLQSAEATAQLDAFQQKAVDLVTSSKAHDAFDLSAESAAQKDLYGRHTFGQSLLLARRLLVSGVKLVTVYWHRDKSGVDTTWDTHKANFTQLKNRLVPQVDKPISVLLEDLDQQGLLDDTLVVWLSEFGRTPKINKNQGGRDHWGPCNSIWMAGAGVPGGQVYGSSDKIAAYPKSNPVSPSDVSATIYYLLGLKPNAHIYDRLDKPIPISQGRPLLRFLQA